MLKRTCDRCGQSIDNEWNKVKYVHDGRPSPYFINCNICNTNTVDDSPDYCEECIDDIKRFAAKKIVRQ